ncbi:MAG: hypothetical protein HC831_04500 [Chloroflexia bacterium]|nr:hypothetical protein [Chloroflexia bacterium]
MYGQADTIIRLDVMSGSSTNFQFNSYSKIISGIEYTNWTRFRVYFKVHDGTHTGNPTANTWELLVHANASPIPGDGGNTLGLDRVELAVENAGSGTATAGIGNYVVITGTSQATADQLITGGANLAVPAYEDVIISYRVGGTNSVQGAVPDYYFVDLVFTLNTQ